MRYVFLTACRNESAILEKFLAEFTTVVTAAGIAQQSMLHVVDDLSTDSSRDILERYRKSPGAISIHVIRAPTNFGNQGAMFFGLLNIEVGADDVLITFDCDGEDDVRQFQSILELGRANADKLVLIERGRRAESLAFKVFFACYKLLFRFLTRQTIVPNNFMLIPGAYIPFIRRSALAPLHFAYAVLKLRLPSVAVVRDRRQRYGGHTSQDLFSLVSHGMVGLMVFYETVIAKLFFLLFLFGFAATAIFGLALLLPDGDFAAQRALLWSVLAMGMGAAWLFALLLSAALALLFKMSVFNQAADERLATANHPR